MASPTQRSLSELRVGGKVQFIEAESKMVATRSRGRGRVLVKGHKGSVMKDEEVLKI